MKRANLKKKILFVGTLVATLGWWPVGCKTQVPGPSVGSPDTAKDPATLVKAESVPKSFLPHPAFAYAKSGGGAVSIADIAERAAPSVVNVSSSRMAHAAPSRMPFFDDPMFRHFFGPRPGPRGAPEREQRGMGSGVIVSKKGVVLTNNHVVQQADKIVVTTHDKREFEARVVGADSKSDLAVLELQGDVSGLKPIAFGDSSRLRLGDVVLAIGNPFGVGQTITMGIVSAKGRANVGIVDYEDFIQTDAAINPGNSGGALVDMEGNLIGINTAILSRSGGYMGIGFAIPTNMAEPIMQSLVEHGKVVRGWLGVSIQNIDRDLAQAMNLSTTSGVLIAEVMKDSPAERAGLEQGDVVLTIDGRKMDSTGRLRNAIAAAGSGKIVKLQILRQGKRQVLDVKLGELPEDVAQASGRGPSGGALDGLTLETLSPANRQKYNIDRSVRSGVVVVDIDPGTPAAASGLRPGDVIVEVNRSKVKNLGNFKQAYKKSKRKVLLLINRGGRNLFLVLKR